MTGDSPEAGAPRSRLLLRGLAVDAMLGVRERLGRAALTALGTVLGVGAIVAILGLTDTARVHVSARFDARRATQVTITEPGAGGALPLDAGEALRQLNGVRSGGLVWTVGAGLPVATRPHGVPGGRHTVLPVIAVSPGGLAASGPVMAEGRPFDAYLHERAARVAIVGSAAAAELGIPALAQPTVFVDGLPFTVVGILADSERRPGAVLSVLVPAATAAAIWGPPQGAEAAATVLVETAPGAAALVGRQAPAALHPQAPERLHVAVPPDPAELRAEVDGDLRRLLLVLGGVCVALGVVAIMSATLVAVLERVPEIGLRRSLGAKGAHIAALFLGESALIGWAASIVGLWAGSSVVVGVSLVNGWEPAISPRVPVVALLVGGLTGIVAGLYPALRAARVAPVEALRR